MLIEAEKDAANIGEKCAQPSTETVPATNNVATDAAKEASKPCSQERRRVGNHRASAKCC